MPCFPEAYAQFLQCTIMEIKHFLHETAYNNVDYLE